MSCRSTPSGSAMTTFARLTSPGHLSDTQIQSLFHEIRRELLTSPTPSTADYHDTLIDARVAILANPALTEARKRSLCDRIDTAISSTPPDAGTVYAITRIVNRARTVGARQQAWLERISTRLGIDTSETVELFRAYQGDIDRDRSADDPATFTDANKVNALAAGLLCERGTVHAMAMLEQRARRAEADRALLLPRRIEPVGLSGPTGIPGVYLAEAGYDPRNGRLEAVVDGPSGRTHHAYQSVPQPIWDRMLTADEPGRIWAEEVRANSTYRYPTQEDADLEAAAPKCTTCGQFASTAHECPVSIEPVVLHPYTRQARWSSGPDPASGVRVRMPATRELLEAATTRPVTISGIYQSFAQPAGPGVVQGSITAWRDDDDLRMNLSNLRCSCPIYRSEHMCPHIQAYAGAVQHRLTESRASRAVRTPADRERLLREAQIRAEAAAATDWTLNDQTMAEARAAFLPSTLMYTDSPELFVADYRAAISDNPTITYMTENAFAGMANRADGNGFGLEIEFAFPDDIDPDDRLAAIAAIGRDLHEAGLTYAPDQQRYRASRDRGIYDTHTDANGIGTWSFERDGSVNGGEIVSPILYDEPETWVNLARVCHIVQAHGGTATPAAGLHVHVGTADFGGDPRAYTELARMFTQHEDVLYRISADPHRGTHRPLKHCSPNTSVPAAGFNNPAAIRFDWQGGDRYRGLNMNGVSGTEADHPEFRLFDASLDPGVIQAQAKLAVGIARASKRIAVDLQAGSTRDKEELGSHAKRAAARGRRRLTDADIVEDSATTRALLDTVFTRPEDKRQLVAIFANTKWIRTRRRT